MSDKISSSFVQTIATCNLAGKQIQLAPGRHWEEVTDPSRARVRVLVQIFAATPSTSPLLQSTSVSLLTVQLLLAARELLTWLTSTAGRIWWPVSDRQDGSGDGAHHKTAHGDASGISVQCR